MTQAYVVTECAKDAAILQGILPLALLSGVEFIDGEGSYGAESIARSLLLSEQLPLVLVLDARTTDESLIEDQMSDLGFLMKQSAGRTPFKMAIAVPEIEAVFFQERQWVEELTQTRLTDLEWQFAQRHPKEFLETLPGGSNRFVEVALAALTEEKRQRFRQHRLVQNVMEFLSGVMVVAS
jgi:hypothetical protein